MRPLWKTVLAAPLLWALSVGLAHNLPVQALARLAPAMFTQNPAPIFINEMHYDNSGTDTGEFIEIAAPAGTDLTGWSIVLYNGSNGTVYDTDPLPTVIPNLGCSYGFVVLQYPSNGIQNGSPDGIALVDSSSTVVQFLSYEGAFTAVGGPANGLTSTDINASQSGSEPAGQSLQLSGTGSNYADFAWSSPSSATPGAFNNGQTLDAANSAPCVAGTVPANGDANIPVDAGLTVNFSEDVTVAGEWFAISCTASGAHTAEVSGGPRSFTLNPDANFASSESCTVTLIASAITDLDGTPDAMATDYSWSFDTAFDFGECFDLATRIHAIQGTGAASERIDEPVIVEGIVVGDYQGDTPLLRGFYLQEEDSQTDALGTTSEGLFVFSDMAVATGDLVRVQGTVTEFGNAGATLTELANVTELQVCASGAAVTPTVIDLPLASVSDWERYEGMLVSIPEQLTVTENFTLGRFGEVHLSANGRLFQPTHLVAPGAPAQEQQALNDRSRILLDDALTAQNPDPVIYPAPYLSATNTLRTGYTVDGLTGILDQRFGEYRVQPLGSVLFNPANPRTTAPEEVGGTLKVASANVLNYFTTLDDGGEDCGPVTNLQECRGANTSAEFERQRAKILAGLAAIHADIVGLVELENNETASLQDLVDGLNEILGAGTYAYINTGFIGTDAIKVGLIYKTTTVIPVGGYAILDSTVDPTFIDTLNRPVLAQTFEEKAGGERLTVAVNHLKSKGSDCNDVGDPDTGDGQGNCNLTRTQAATALVNWLASDPTGNGDADFLIIGDLNSYAQEDPITAITDAGYTDLLAHFHGQGAYSYVFDGQSGYLDYALAGAGLLDQVTGVTEWHANTDEPIVFDYNVEFKSPAQVEYFYSPEPYRFSDHDPVVVGLDLESETTITIAKDARPDNRRNFRFGGDLGRFRLDDPGFEEHDPFSASHTFTVEPGTYSVFEDVPHHWHLTNIACTGGITSVDLISHSVAITVAAGQHATCTFTNEHGSDILVHNYYDRNADGRRVREPGLHGWEISLYDGEGTLIDSDTTNGVGKVHFRNVAPGEYTVCETQRGGWSNSQPGTLDATYGKPCYALAAEPAQVWVVEFGNHPSEQASAAGVQTTALPTVHAMAVEDVDDESYEDDGPFVDAELEQPAQGDGAPLFLPSITR